MPIKKAKEPKPPKEKKVKAPKEKKPKKPKKERPPKGKKGKNTANAPEEVEELEEGQQPKKKKPLLLLLIPPVVIVAAVVIIIVFVVLPKLNGETEVDPEPTASVEPDPPELPSAIPLGDDASIVGLALGSDESGAQAVKSKRVTYTYTNLNDAGKAAETYAGQLAKESPSFSVVNEEFVREREAPDYTTTEGMVLLARNAPAAKQDTPVEEEPSVKESLTGGILGPIVGGESGFNNGLEEPIPTPEPEAPPTYVHTVRITWTPGQCVVTVDEVEGKVTSPANNAIPAGQALTIRGAQSRLAEMAPAQLGLDGESMDEYELIPMDATEMVNGTACIRVNVYNGSGADIPNEYRGSYLMSIDGLHLYRLDTITNEVTELKDYP